MKIKDFSVVSEEEEMNFTRKMSTTSSEKYIDFLEKHWFLSK